MTGTEKNTSARATDTARESAPATLEALKLANGEFERLLVFLDDMSETIEAIEMGLETGDRSKFDPAALMRLVKRAVDSEITAVDSANGRIESVLFLE